MEKLFLVVVVGGLLFAAWAVAKSFTKKATPKVSSGGVLPTEPADTTKPNTNNQF